MNTQQTIVHCKFIRHGRTQANLEKRYIGRTDEPLLKGEERSFGDWKDCVADVVYTSPMKRCVQTSAYIFPDKEPVIIEDFREIDFGKFEMKNYQELQDDANYIRWIESNGTLAFPNGESRGDFMKRCMNGFHQMIADITRNYYGYSEVSVACVVHGGTIMAILSQLLGGDYFDYQCANGQGYEVNLCIKDGNHIHK